MVHRCVLSATQTPFRGQSMGFFLEIPPARYFRTLDLTQLLTVR